MEKYFTKFNNQFHGIIAGPLLIFILLFLQLDKGRFTAPFGGYDYLYFAVGAFVISLGYFYWVFRNFRMRRKELIGKSDFITRLESYRAESVRFYILMTLSGVIAIIVVFLTGELAFSFIYMIQLFLLSVYRPSVHNICKYLDLKGEERDIVLKKKEFSIKE